MDPSPTSNPIPGAIVVGKTYDLMLWIVQKVEKFPKSYRFSVGQRLIDTGLDLLLLLVEAAYRKDKREALRTAGVRTNALRYLLSRSPGSWPALIGEPLRARRCAGSTSPLPKRVRLRGRAERIRSWTR